ncbi:MAG: hypothetical protein KME16_14150 [Scytolyngbya sp. HA4215-MV1]|nr:hypothetical protein [Scytolyngbya sp. HA4215-MV1]
MKLALVKSISFLVSAAILAVGCGKVSAQAASAQPVSAQPESANPSTTETTAIAALPSSSAIVPGDSSNPLATPMPADLTSLNIVSAPVHVAAKPALAEPTSQIHLAEPGSAAADHSVGTGVGANPTVAIVHPVEESVPTPAPAATVPVPGTAFLSAALLTDSSHSPKATSDRPIETMPNAVAQEVVPGRATRSGPSYLGIGGNIGIGDGDTALGEGSFAILSKIGLTQRISVRPSVLIASDVTILIPVTYDFYPIGEDDINFRVAPFLGAGLAISLGNDSAVDLLVTGGVDVPLSRQFTATASINASLFDNPAVGLLLGIGYNF